MWVWFSNAIAPLAWQVRIGGFSTKKSSHNSMIERWPKKAQGSRAFVHLILSREGFSSSFSRGYHSLRSSAMTNVAVGDGAASSIDRGKQASGITESVPDPLSC